MSELDFVGFVTSDGKLLEAGATCFTWVCFPLGIELSHVVHTVGNTLRWLFALS